jgi:hypothetical protein
MFDNKNQCFEKKLRQIASVYIVKTNYFVTAFFPFFRLKRTYCYNDCKSILLFLRDGQ